MSHVQTRKFHSSARFKPTVRPAAINSHEAASRLRKLCSTEQTDREQWVREVLDLAAQWTGALGVLLITRDASGQLTIQPDAVAPPHVAQLRSLMQNVISLASSACSEAKPQAAMDAGEEVLMVVAPMLGDGPAQALALAIGAESPDTAKQMAPFLTQLASWIAALLIKADNLAVPDHKAESNLDIQALDRAIEAASLKPTLGEAAKVLCDWLQQRTRRLNANVALGARTDCKGACRLLAYSAVDKVDLRSQFAKQLQEVMEESRIAAELPDQEGELDIGSTSATIALRQMGAVISDRDVLRNADGSVLAIILTLDPVDDRVPVAAPLPDHLSRPLARQLRLLHAAQPNRLTRWMRDNLGQRSWFRHPTTWVAAATVALLLCVPAPLKIRCDCVAQPTKRRYVAAPYDGRLLQVHVSPGQHVSKGDILAKMDGDEIADELASLQADLEAARKHQDQVWEDLAERQIAELEVQRIEIQIRKWQHRERHLTVVSPIDGVVIGGDIRRLDGAKVSLGQTLLEIGPLDEMLIELEIPDEDIAHVRAGSQVNYRLEALPWQPASGKIVRVDPRSELRDGRKCLHRGTQRPHNRCCDASRYAW